MAGTNPIAAPSGTNSARKLTCTLPEAAERMGVRVAWLRAKVAAREVPFVATGKRSVGFTDEQIAQVVEALTVQPTGTPKSLTSTRARRRSA